MIKNVFLEIGCQYNAFIIHLVCKPLKIFFNSLKGFYSNYLVLIFGHVFFPISNRDMDKNVILQNA